MSARISVIVPAYNYAEYLPDALDSVIAQSVTDWECIIVDDGSTDATSDVARRYVEQDSRFRYVRQPNHGLSAARNTGVRATSGSYVQFLDADDKLAPTKLELQAGYLDAHPEVDLVYGLATFFRTEDPARVLYSLRGHLSRPLLQKVENNEEALRKLQEFNITTAVAMLVRRDVFTRAGFFNEAVSACEDWDFWLRCSIAGCEFRYIATEDPVAFVRTHAGSMSRSNQRMWNGLVQAASTFRDTPAGRLWNEPILPAVYEMAAGVSAVDHGRRGEGVIRIWRASRTAQSTLTRLRWITYAIAGVLLPRRAFLWVVFRPMPERGLEWLRRLKR